LIFNAVTRLEHFAYGAFHGGFMNHQAYRAFDAQGRRKYLTRQEGLAFVQEVLALPLRERLLCQVLYYAGCRPSEVISLTVSDFDLGESVVQIRCLKKQGKLVIRRIPLPVWLTTAVIELGTVHESGLLWPISRTTVWRLIKRVMRPLGINGVHACPKGLRHGFGVRGVLAKLPVHLLQRWMGHSSPHTTAIYLEVQDEEERELMARMWN
jgi:integrase/recombinase XerD